MVPAVPGAGPGMVLRGGQEECVLHGGQATGCLEKRAGKWWQGTVVAPGCCRMGLCRIWGCGVC